MAYKIVNDDSLTSVANAIRVQGSISGTLEFPAGFVSAIQNLSPSENDALVITLTDSAAVSETHGYHWTPDCSYNDYYEAVNQQRPIGLKVNCTICGDAFARRINNSPSQLEYVIVEVIENANHNVIGLANKYYRFTNSGVTLDNEFFTPLPWDATAVTSDVASGKIFYTSNGREVGTATLGSNDFIITASKDGQDNFTIDKTFAEIKSAYQDGKRLVVCSTDYIVGYYEYVDTGTPSDDYFYIGVFSRTAHDLVELCYNYYSSMVIPEVYNTYYCPYGNATPSDVASGKTFINGSGRQTGTATPPSGTMSITSNGTYDVTQYASADVNVSGGGGASNVVVGTFTVGSSVYGVVETVDIPYSGNGYPISLTLMVASGIDGASLWKTTTLRYAVGQLSVCKSYADVAPKWNGSSTDDQASVIRLHKNSTSSPTSYSAMLSNNEYMFVNSNPRGQNSNIVRFANAKTLKYYTANGASYGLLPNETYRYCIVYSE